MNKAQFRHHLFTLTEKELYYRDCPNERNNYYNKLEKMGLLDESGTFHFPTFKHLSSIDKSYSSMFNTNHNLDFVCLNGKLALKRQPRYYDIPMHYHDYIGINYVYSGCVQGIAEKICFDLHTGDLCLMDNHVKHQISKAEENDIILNLQIDPEYFTSSVLYRLKDSGIVARFLIDSIQNKKERQNFLIFHCEDSEAIRYAFESIFYECCNPKISSSQLIESYLHIIFIEMVRCYQQQEELLQSENSSHGYFTEILQYITDHCSSCTLQSVADAFSYNSKYLSRIIKNQTGKTFKEIQLEARMNKAIFLISNSDMSISSISVECGYQNQNFFYKKFSEFYGITPGEYRKNPSH